MLDAQLLARSLVREPLLTPRGRSNTILGVTDDQAIVATSRSPEGRPVQLEWLQSALDQVAAGESLTIEPQSASFRSAFIGAVCRTVPQFEVVEGSPPFVRLDPAADASERVVAELERRLEMYAELLDHGGPEGVPPLLLRAIGIYGGASGVWTDSPRTRPVGDGQSVAVGVLHTGRHYADDLSEDALLYHYPQTSRQRGRDEAEIRATKTAGELRLPIFVVLQQGALRTVRRGWVATWDDPEQLFLIEFGPRPVRVQRGDQLDDRAFELFEDRRDVMRTVRGRPNQQRFKMGVIQRYGACCSLCSVAALELIHAAHLVPDADRGTSDPRNGVPLCVNHHTALDRHLIAIEPSTHRVLVAKGQDSEALNLTRRDLAHLPAQPAEEALQYRWDRRKDDCWSPA